MNFYNDKIDDYLTGKLTDADKVAMEEGMKKDPSLKSEVDFQHDVIESLKNARRIQLKNRLNNIDMSATTSGVSSTVKIAASIITIGLIGAGVYYMSVLSSKEDSAKEVSISNTQSLSSNTTTKVEVIEDNNTINNENVTLKENKSQSASRKSVVINKSTSSASKIDNEVYAKAEVPNGILTEVDSDRMYRDKSIEIPDGNIAESNERKMTSPDISIDDNNKSDFSYKYYNNKLFLYGDFQDQPYNLVEINTPKMKQLYLYYDGSFYELKSNQTKATRLKEVKDATLLEQLRNKK